MLVPASVDAKLRNRRGLTAEQVRAEGRRIMSVMHGGYDELSEFDLTEDEIDAMMAAGEPVEVVGPPDIDRRARFEVVLEEDRRYTWRLSTPDGEVLAKSQMFTTKAAAVGAAEVAMKMSLGAALVDRTAG